MKPGTLTSGYTADRETRAYNDRLKKRTVSELKMKISKPLVHIYYTLDSRCVNAILASHLFTNNIFPNKFCNCGEEETIYTFSLNAEIISIPEIYF